MTKHKHRVHILTPGFTSPNGSAFLMPLILHRQVLEGAGISLQFFSTRVAALTDCDILIIDGKFHRERWTNDGEVVVEEFAKLKDQVRNLIFVDNRDSTGWDQARVLPLVTLYCKAQLLRDRTMYRRPFYGYRIFSDYYHTAFNVEDDQPGFSDTVEAPALLEKMTITWNSGLADYSWLGPYRMAAYRFLPLRSLLHFPQEYFIPSADRPHDFSCRFWTNYQRNSVSFQRRETARLLASRIKTAKLSRRLYLNELRTSKVAISPFGLGEITLRDFEVFLAGALLVKPDMSHLETWPNLFQDSETMIAYRWDLANLEERIDAILSDYPKYLDIATEGQARYRRHLCGPDAAALFANHFGEILSKCVRLSGRSVK